jgi:FtsZ-interacting cell division protein ZipA
MTIDDDGRFARCDDDGPVLYLLINQETQGFAAASMRTMSTHGVTFLLDVPRVANGDRVLTQMVELARRFAEALHGALVDDNRRPLSDVRNRADPPAGGAIPDGDGASPGAGRRALAQRLFS